MHTSRGPCQVSPGDRSEPLLKAVVNSAAHIRHPQRVHHVIRIRQS